MADAPAPVSSGIAEPQEEAGTQLVREIGWQAGFWNALGGASLMVFSVGYLGCRSTPNRAVTLGLSALRAASHCL